MKKILITGCRGFVGTQFWNRLWDENYLIGIDIVNGHDARDFFRNDDTRFDLVIHLAAVVGGRKTIEGSPLSVAVDLSIDSELFQWALRTKPGRILYYSSSAAYPLYLQGGYDMYKLNEEDIDLNDVRSADLTYGWSKLTGEYLAQFAEAEGVRTHVFRPFSGYGETQALDYPFPSFIKRGKERQNPFQVWGDGNQVRDFIHIDDIVAATLEAVEQDVPGPVNLGSGRPISFNDLADLVMKEAGYYGEIEHLMAEPVDVKYRVANNRKMLSFYTPRVSLEEGIRRSLRAN